MQVSIYSGATDASSSAAISVQSVINEIRSGTYRMAVGWVRECADNGDEDAAIEAKKSLPCVTFGGVFSYRKIVGVREYSQLVVIDVDHLDCIEEAEEMRDAFTDLALCAFVSPSGRGVKIVFKHDVPDAANHYSAWLACSNLVIERFPDANVDPSGKDVCRLCFLSFDPLAWINEDCPTIHCPIVTEPQRDDRIITGTPSDPITSNRHEWMCGVAARLVRSIGQDAPRDMIVQTVKQMWADRVVGRSLGEGEAERAVDGAIEKFNMLPNVEFDMVGKRAADAILSHDVEPDESEDLEYEPWPNHLLSWPGIIGDAVRDIELGAAKFRKELALGASLCSWASVIGRMVMGPTGVRPNLYVIGLAGTGGGKEAPRVYWKKAMLAAGAMEFLGAETVTSETALYSMLSQRPTCTMMIDEIGRFISGMNGKRAASHEAAIMTSMLTLYSLSQSTFAGKAFADQKQRPIEAIHQPHLSISACGNPSEFWKSLTRNEISNGLIPRMLIFPVDPTMPKLRNLPSREPDEKIIERIKLWREHRPMLSSILIPEPVRIDYAPGVDRIWQAYTDELYEAASRSNDDNERDILSRLWENAQKLAIIAATSTADPSNLGAIQIREADSVLAIETMRYTSRQTLKRVRRHLSESEYHRNLKDVLAWIYDAGENGRTQAATYRRMQHLPRAQREDILQSLVESKQAACAMVNGKSSVVAWRYLPRLCDTPAGDGAEAAFDHG